MASLTELTDDARGAFSRRNALSVILGVHDPRGASSADMTVRRRILLLQLACLVLVALALAIAVLALSSGERFAARVDATERRLETLGELSSDTRGYGREVGDVLLLGRAQMRELNEVRIDLERGFARLAQVTRDKVAAGDSGQMEAGLRDVETARRMVELYHSIDLSTTRLLGLERGMSRDQAIAAYQRDVVFRLTSELEPLLATDIDNETQDAARDLEAFRGQQTLLYGAAGVLAILALLAVVGLGLYLRRGIGRDAAGQTVEIEARAGALREANERLKDVDVRRAQFLADVSHELRTPLTILRGEADVALRGSPTPDEQRQSLELIQGQAAELGALLDELIAFARSDAETQDYVTEKTRLDRIVSAAVQEGEVLAETREIKLTADLKDHAAEIDADFRKLKQALIIGIDNAVKHSPPGGRIVVATARQGNAVTISIADKGAGVSSADEGRLFERFYRGQSRPEMADQGLGIGLSIAKGIVERHAGTISLGNRQEGGAVLEITLPVAREATA